MQLTRTDWCCRVSRCAGRRDEERKLKEIGFQESESIFCRILSGTAEGLNKTVRSIMVLDCNMISFDVSWFWQLNNVPVRIHFTNSKGKSVDHSGAATKRIDTNRFLAEKPFKVLAPPLGSSRAREMWISQCGKNLTADPFLRDWWNVSEPKNFWSGTFGKSAWQSVGYYTQLLIAACIFL